MELMQQILNGINTSAFIINREKKVLFVNKELSNLLHQSEEELIGSCFGVVVKCKYTVSMKDGCGMSSECKDCSLRKYLDHGIATKETLDGEINVIANVKGIDVPFSARIKVSSGIEHATSISNGEELFLISIVEQSSDAERNNMERIFFHDIMNTASSLYNVIRLLKLKGELYEEDEDIQMLEGYIKDIIDEIEYHRSIIFAERGGLHVMMEELSISRLLGQIITLFKKNETFHSIQIILDVPEEEVKVCSDSVLLRKIVINLVKNALEANENQSVIRISVRNEKNNVKILIHNEEVILSSVQKEIFEKGYSTKGKGRGFGTYGSRMLLHKYLGGELTFFSNEEEGTEFIITLPKEVPDENTNC